MNTTRNIALTINKYQNGYVFTYSDIIKDVKNKDAVIKALNRMVKSNKIAKLSKGKYYKPETTPFGVLQPNPSQVVKDLLYDGSKIIGYLTGYSVYNKLSLTTQVSNTIQIGRNEIRPGFKRDRYTITFVKQKNIITKENIPLLQILDAIRYIKKIPDTSIETSCKRLLVILENLPEKKKENIVRLALKYPPATKALLGALLDELKASSITERLYKSLNPISKYKISDVNKVISTTDKWNII